MSDPVAEALQPPYRAVYEAARARGLAPSDALAEAYNTPPPGTVEHYQQQGLSKRAATVLAAPYGDQTDGLRRLGFSESAIRQTRAGEQQPGRLLDRHPAKGKLLEALRASYLPTDAASVSKATEDLRYFWRDGEDRAIKSAVKMAQQRHSGGTR